jgi:GH24 family phage-related lysozyme (muramidase)
MNSPLSPAAEKLILDYEVGGGEKYYNKFLKHPTWPGGQSGVTICVGEDLGYMSKGEFSQYFGGISFQDRLRLERCLGIKGSKAKPAADNVRDIVIPWATAIDIFRTKRILAEVAKTQAAFPGSDDLPDDAFGALVSLVFNRGPGMKDSPANSGNRREMRNIRLHVRTGSLAGIAQELRRMKRLWVGKGLDGLLKRREAEAQLVESCI